MLDGMEVGYDLPVAVILVPSSWYNQPASTSASGSAIHVYVPGTGGVSAAAVASAARWRERTVRRSWRYLRSACLVYRP